MKATREIGTMPGVEMQSPRWGNKEWTRKVEEVYWEESSPPVGTNGAVEWAPVGNTMYRGRLSTCMTSSLREFCRKLMTLGGIHSELNIGQSKTR